MQWNTAVHFIDTENDVEVLDEFALFIKTSVFAKNMKHFLSIFICQWIL